MVRSLTTTVPWVTILCTSDVPDRPKKLANKGKSSPRVRQREKKKKKDRERQTEKNIEKGIGESTARDD